MSSNSSKNYNSGGIGFFGALTILFIGLKLVGVINWSWVWVLCPLWGGFVLVALFLLLVFIFNILRISKMKKEIEKKRKRRNK